jgi:hypothetical protein
MGIGVETVAGHRIRCEDFDLGEIDVDEFGVLLATATTNLPNKLYRSEAEIG